MSVRQVVKCDKCGEEFANSGYHIGIGMLHWMRGEVDMGMNAGMERTFHLCNGCARALFGLVPMLANGIIVPRPQE